MQITTNKTFTLDWSLLAGDERRSSGWLIGDETVGDEAHRPAETQPLRVLLAVLDLNLRQKLAAVLRLDGHQITEAEDPVSPQRYLDGPRPEAAVDVVICGTALCGEGSKGRNLGGLLVLGRDHRTGAMSTLVPLSGKSLVQDARDLAQIRRFVRQQGEIS